MNSRAIQPGCSEVIKGIMKKIASILWLLVIAPFLNAQVPAWADPDYREFVYPRENYYTGYASQHVSEDEDLQQEIEKTVTAAKHNLSESISTAIKTKSELVRTEFMKNARNNSFEFDLNTIFNSWSVATSENNINGLQQLEPVYDKKSRKAYAFVYVEKAKLALRNKNMVDMGLLFLGKALGNAVFLAQNGQEVSALEQLASLSGKFAEIEVAQAIICSIEYESYRLDDYINLRISIDNAFSIVENSRSLDIEGSSKIMVDRLREEVGEQFNHIIVVRYITYEGFEGRQYITKFSRLFSEELNRQLTAENFLVKYNPANLMSTGTEYVSLEGSYYCDSNAITVYLSLIGKPTDKLVVKISGLVSKKWLESEQITYIPDVVLEMTKRDSIRKKLLAEETHFGDFDLHLWTNKMDTQPVIEEGDSLNIFIQVNKPCWIRGLYFQADGLTVQLFDDFYISPNEVGKILDVGKRQNVRLTLTKPYGKEDLLIAASDRRFIRLNTEVIPISGKTGGIRVVHDDDSTAIANTKGVICEVDGNMPTGSFYAQKHISLMVVPPK
jgi:hypothetical protein